MIEPKKCKYCDKKIEGYNSKQINASLCSFWNKGWIQIRIEEKTPTTHNGFWTVNVAPKDFPEFKHWKYRVGCEQQKTCGLQFTTNGWYGCSLMGGIDRLLKHGGDELEEIVLDPRYRRYCKW